MYPNYVPPNLNYTTEESSDSDSDNYLIKKKPKLLHNPGPSSLHQGVVAPDPHRRGTPPEMVLKQN